MYNHISEYTFHYSLNKQHPIMIVYMKGTEITQRKVKVLTMDEHKICALDINKKAIRTFKKENILSAMKLSSLS